MHDLRWSRIPQNRYVDVTAWCVCGWKSESRTTRDQDDPGPILERAFLNHLGSDRLNLNARVEVA